MFRYEQYLFETEYMDFIQVIICTDAMCLNISKKTGFMQLGWMDYLVDKVGYENNI